MNRIWAADISITREQARVVIERQFPELAPADVRWWNEGWDNTLFEVNERYVFRFPRRAVAVDLLQRELGILPHLAERLPAAIPNPRFLGTPGDGFPFPFFGYDKLPGRPPHEARPTEEQRAASAGRWARFLRALHQVPVSDAIRWGIADSDAIGRLDVARRAPQLAARAQTLHEKGVLTDVAPVLEMAASAASWGDAAGTGPMAVVHGDLNFRNFLVDETGALCGVIDWGDAHIGHPAIDLTVVYSFLPPQAREAFWRVYGPVPDRVRRLARFRALYSSVLILEYAVDIGDELQAEEALRGIAWSLAD
ncbi:MAG: phosphotransferase [Alicyclobacillus macrosporangiidus]|uniref:phosphotransferase n=1 Tax=Alicyclobacillus macrosporangiidus TaxID=392015 RepID=UPI0026F0EEA7|nr:phosphotransferase [Alicyclobacillus macrosporangiidus]MCL6598409.1 phosphotransferase [Alicyclobacillus macrosporangiidus]